MVASSTVPRRRRQQRRVHKDRVNLYCTTELRVRLKHVAADRVTSETASAVWLLERALDWWEGNLPDERFLGKRVAS